MWAYGLDQAGLGQGQVAGTCNCIDEPSSSIHIESPTRCNSVLKFYFIFI